MSSQGLFNRLLLLLLLLACCLLKCVAHPQTLRRGVKARQDKTSSVKFSFTIQVVFACLFLAFHQKETFQKRDMWVVIRQQ